MKVTRRRFAQAASSAIAFVAAGVIGLPARAAIAISPDEARAIAKEAYIYGFPMVDYYRIMWAYFVNDKDMQYKGPPNGLYSEANVYTPADKAVQTPNSDTRRIPFAGLICEPNR